MPSPDAQYNFPQLSPPSGKPILKFDAENPRFVDLIDSIGSYIGKAGFSIIVNDNEDGLTTSLSIIKTDAFYAHIQVIGSTDFTITHLLGKKPSVEIIDSDGEIAVCHIIYVDDNNVRIRTSVLFSGIVYLN